MIILVPRCLARVLGNRELSVLLAHRSITELSMLWVCLGGHMSQLACLVRMLKWLVRWVSFLLLKLSRAHVAHGRIQISCSGYLLG